MPSAATHFENPPAFRQSSRALQVANAPKSLLSHVHLQHAAIGKHDFPRLVSGKPDRRSVFGGGEGDCNLVAWLEGSSGPVISAHDARALAFDRPIYYVTFVVLHVHKKFAMGIGPHKFRHHPREVNPMLLVVRRISMVRPYRAANQQKARDQDDECC